MREMTPFKYVEFYDVPHCIAFRYEDKHIMLQSFFDEVLDEYPDHYSVYLLPESCDFPAKGESWEPLTKAALTCIGKIQIFEVNFDPSKREMLDASFVSKLIAEAKPTSH